MSKINHYIFPDFLLGGDAFFGVTKDLIAGFTHFLKFTAGLSEPVKEFSFRAFTIKCNELEDYLSEIPGDFDVIISFKPVGEYKDDEKIITKEVVDFIDEDDFDLGELGFEFGNN